ncbi:ketoacyl-ACP synthase III [Clostridium felsineum]|uniref:ketoacyl-ACP synthase III n=1 Tax=Clostridium felsineum TaxID=36839 RepID=UPI00098CDA7E|nr:ketoacyl-ACP synthase III [Clostridium felsineum]URZ18160.1 3-oxoacyl-[acyl-carrier-protein] synthase 3 [Clostridium felsineum DSM 794]
MKVDALVTVVPKNKLGQAELEKRFGIKQAKRVSMITGIKERHVVTGDMRALELILKAAETAINKAGGDRNFDAIFVITQTPEYKFPSTACIVQHRLGINKNVLAYDINLGCSGYVYGLITANAFIESKLFKRILLIVGDLTQSTACKEDSSSYPLFGDAYSATIISSHHKKNQIQAIDYGTNGYGAKNLITYVGGCRYRNEEEYKKHNSYNAENKVKFPSYVYMDGAEVFNFSIDVVPDMIKNLLSISNYKLEELDYFFFHQANAFIIKHLCQKLNIDIKKVPISLNKYGNTSGASIPITICDFIENNKVDKIIHSVLLGFGVGYSWAGVIIDLDPKVVLPVIEI